MVEFPTTIRIGYRDYRIERWNNLSATGAQKYGECNHVSAVIKIAGQTIDDAPVQAAETLIHEILHGVCTVGQRADVDDEERTVGIISAVLTQVWRDNPHVVAWLDSILGRPPAATMTMAEIARRHIRPVPGEAAFSG